MATRTVRKCLLDAVTIVDQYGLKRSEITSITVSAYGQIDIHVKPIAFERVFQKMGLSIHEVTQSRFSDHFHFNFTKHGTRWVCLVKVSEVESMQLLNPLAIADSSTETLRINGKSQLLLAGPAS